jgi:hypothetical protein
VGISASGIVRTKAFKFGASALCVAAVAGGIGTAVLQTSSAEAAKTVTYKQWSFGVISDTQWTVADDGYNPNETATNIIKQIDSQFVKAGVKLVVAVGDTTNDGDKTSVDTRALYAQDLYNAGIGFYPLRGNHEATETSSDASWKNSAAEFAYAYPQIGTGINNKTPSAITTSIIPALDLTNNAPAAKSGHPFMAGYGFSFPTAVNSANKSLSYSFRYNNATFVLLDQFIDQSSFADDASNSDSNSSTIAQQQPWISSVLSHRPAGTQAFVFTHKNLLGGNHKDNLFGPQVTSADPGDGDGLNPATLTVDQLALYNAKQSAENALLGSLQSNMVRYIISGHDHHDYLSLVTSPNGSSKVHQAIEASDSSKFYTPKTPVSANDVPLQQDLARVGYYIVAVDGPRVTIDYYGDTTGGGYYGVNGGTFTFTKIASERYSLNGKDVVVNQGGSYTTVSDNTNVADDMENGFKGTSMAILAGTNGSVQKTNYNKPIQNDVNTGWKAAQAGLNSDILDLSGMWLTLSGPTTDQYVLSMSYRNSPFINGGALLSGKFCLLARAANGKWVKAVSLNSTGTPSFVLGAWNSSYAIGTYGVDPVARKAWAVLDYNGEFAVGQVK